MSSTFTLQSSPAAQSTATVFWPACRVTGSVTVAQSSQLAVGGSVIWVGVPLTSRVIVRGAGPPSAPM